jgi:hypothetical protein
MSKDLTDCRTPKRRHLSLFVRLVLTSWSFAGIFLFTVTLSHDKVLSLTSAVFFTALDFVFPIEKKREEQ